MADGWWLMAPRKGLDLSELSQRLVSTVHDRKLLCAAVMGSNLVFLSRRDSNLRVVRWGGWSWLRRWNRFPKSRSIVRAFLFREKKDLVVCWGGSAASSGWLWGSFLIQKALPAQNSVAEKVGAATYDSSCWVWAITVWTSILDRCVISHVFRAF